MVCTLNHHQCGDKLSILSPKRARRLYDERVADDERALAWLIVLSVEAFMATLKKASVVMHGLQDLHLGSDSLGFNSV